MLEYLMFLFLVLLLMQDECNLHVNFEVLLNVNTRYCIRFDAVVNGMTILVYIFWAVMTILIKGLKLGPIWWPTLNWAHPLVGCGAVLLLSLIHI